MFTVTAGQLASLAHAPLDVRMPILIQIKAYFRDLNRVIARSVHGALNGVALNKMGSDGEVSYPINSLKN